jgi:hypothetical protein
MKGTYRAIEISKPGVFTEVSRPLQDPAERAHSGRYSAAALF